MTEPYGTRFERRAPAKANASAQENPTLSQAAIARTGELDSRAEVGPVTLHARAGKHSVRHARSAGSRPRLAKTPGSSTEGVVLLASRRWSGRTPKRRRRGSRRNAVRW